MESALQPHPLPESLKARLAATIVEQRPRLRAFVRRQLADLAEVEDIVQDVFTELAAAGDVMRGIEHIGAWLRRVARNRIIDRYRARGREAPSLDAPMAAAAEDTDADDSAIDALIAPAGEEPERAFLRERLIDELGSALAELPAAQRDVFLAHEIEGVSFKELAAVTGESINTLLGRKHAAVRQLRRRLRDIRDLIQP